MATQITSVALVLLAMAGHVLTQNETTVQPEKVTPPDIPASSTTTTTERPVSTTETRKTRLSSGRGRGRGRGFPRREENSSRRLSIQTISHSELARENARRGGAVDPIFGMGESTNHEEVLRRQMDTLILLLQRVSDRLTSLETLQSQRNERIDTINYRLTKIELHAEERKANFLELSNVIRHRMESTDFELQSIKTLLDSLKTDAREMGSKHVELRAFLESQSNRQSDGDTSVSRSGLVKIQQLMSNMKNLQGMTTSLKDKLKEMSHNITILTNSTNYLHQMSDTLVTKQYLHTSLLDMKPSLSPFEALTPLLLQQQAPQRGRGKKDPEDCWALKKSGAKKSGVHRIHPLGSPTPFFVYCDMKTDGGGWTVIQRREDGTVDFLREWSEYKHGFGNLAGEFWLGNEKIHHLTNRHVSELRVDLADFDQQKGYAKYAAFAIGSEEEGYSLKMLGEYKGDAGDSLSYQVGQRFSTIDNDFDAHPSANCARDHEGAWWYRACETSNLNGRYLHGPTPLDHEYKGLYWYDFRGPMYSLWRSKMMVRRGGHVNEPIFKDMKGLTTPRPAPTFEAIPTEESSQEYPPGRNPNPKHDPYYDYK